MARIKRRSYARDVSPYPRFDLPLVPKIMSNIPGLDIRIPNLWSAKYRLLFDLGTESWNDLGEKICIDLSETILTIVRKRLGQWALSDFALTEIGLDYSQLLDLELSPRVKQLIGRQAEADRAQILAPWKHPGPLLPPTISSIVKLRGFAPRQALELFGVIEMVCGPGLPVSLTSLRSTYGSRPSHRSEAAGVNQNPGSLTQRLKSLEVLGLSKSTVISLNKAGVTIVIELTSLSEQELSKFKGIGPWKIFEIKSALEDSGMVLRQEPAVNSKQ